MNAATESVWVTRAAHTQFIHALNFKPGLHYEQSYTMLTLHGKIIIIVMTNCIPVELY